MNKIISILTVLVLSVGSAVAAESAEYKMETYENYGYAAGASVMPTSGLKGGLRGAHVAANHHRENSYYPGYTVMAPKTDK